MSNVADAAVLEAPDPADVGAIGVEDLHLEPQDVELEDYKVVVDDLVPAAEVPLAAPQHNVPPEVLRLDPELTPLVGGEADDTGRAGDQPLLHHGPEFKRDDEHGDVLLVPDLHVELDRFTCSLLVAGPRPPASAP